MREDWEYKTFGEIGSFLRGKNIQKADFVSGGLPCIHYGQIHTKFDISIDYHLSEIPQEVYDKAIIASPGDVIIAITSEDIDGSCKSVVWLGNYDIAVSAHAAILKHNMNGKFIAYYLRSNTFFTQKLKYARGFKVMEIKTKDLAKLVLPIPPKPTQLSIVSELDKLNELIRIKKEQLKDYDALAQSIFYEMFGDPVENEKGWEVKKLKDISRKIGDGLHGTPEYSELDTGWYFINGNNLENGCISIKSTTKKVTDFVRKKYYVEMDDFTLLVSINGTLGKSAFYNGENVILGKSACYIKLNKDVNKLFIYEIIRGEYFKRYAESVCTGTTIRNVSLKAMREFPIIYPPLPLQHSFAQKIEQIEQQKATIQKTITDLETLLAARMQYWFD